MAVDKGYIETKAAVVAGDIGYICEHAPAIKAERLKWETGILCIMTNTAHSVFGDISDVYTIRRIFEQVVTVRSILIEIRDPDNDMVEPPKHAVLNDIRWCLDRLACIVMEISRLMSQAEIDAHQDIFSDCYDILEIPK